MKMQFLTILLGIAVVPGFAAADDWKDESGHRYREGRRHHGETPWWARGRGYWDGHFRHSPQWQGRYYGPPARFYPQYGPPVQHFYRWGVDEDDLEDWQEDREDWLEDRRERLEEQREDYEDWLEDRREREEEWRERERRFYRHR